MSAPEIDIHHVAKLARLELSEEEATRYQDQLGGILTYIDKLSEHDLEDAEPAAHALPVMDVTRPDEVAPGLSQEAVLANAPREVAGQFQIPKVLE
jgi:aspartyl-tRNA(Asn)/glutamyl-tRNA(Gln) amidotransferase subunit C